jgi:hypothetical protein
MNLQEKALRANIRRAITAVKKKKNSIVNEEKEFRTHIRKLISLEKALMERSIPDNETPPSKSTGINVLADLLRNIIPSLKNDYVKATSSPEERKSFRSHIINAIEKSLVSVKTNKDAGTDKQDDLEEEINVTLSDEEEDKFIDIRTDKEKEEEEGPSDPKEEFGIEGMSSPEEIQGRNRAFDAYKSIESQIVDAYDTLAIPEDQELFYDYLIANAKLYFDKFEQEMGGTPDEPTNQAYKDAKAQDDETPEEPIPDPSDEPAAEEPEGDTGDDELGAAGEEGEAEMLHQEASGPTKVTKGKFRDNVNKYLKAQGYFEMSGEEKKDFLTKMRTNKKLADELAKPRE